VQQSGDRLRVTVKLVKPDSSVAWGELFEGTPSELFQIQNTIVQQVMSALDITDPSAVGTSGRTITRNPEAFAEYSRGRALLDRVDVPGTARQMRPGTSRRYRLPPSPVEGMRHPNYGRSQFNTRWMGPAVGSCVRRLTRKRWPSGVTS